MKKIVLVDGNNLMFRAFYAVNTSSGFLRSKKGMPTNALFGFTNMIKKIIREENPTYMVVAFDKGKNFRKQEFDFYKAGRKETPSELTEQFPYARKILEAMGIKYLDHEPYEADDIIGTISEMCESNDELECLIISSDVDLMQLIAPSTSMKLLKQKSHILYNEKTFQEEYKLNPINIIDLKAIMGDSSDNIPGVKGIGEKGALKLLQEFKTLDGVYDAIDNIKGAVHDKLVNDKENAYMSYKIATIYKKVPLDIELSDLLYLGDQEFITELFSELEFKSLLKDKIIINETKNNNKNFINLDEDGLKNKEFCNDLSLYIETDGENYHKAKMLGIAIADECGIYFIEPELIEYLKPKLINKKISTYHAKKHIRFIGNIFSDDLMLSEFLLNNNVKDDISSIMDSDIYSFAQLKKSKYQNVCEFACNKAEFIFKKMSDSLKNLEEENLFNLYKNIEFPLIKVLYDMEVAGVVCEQEELSNQQVYIINQMEKISGEIYELAGEEFNLQSPRQLGDILFEKLCIAKGKKNKTGYSTDAKILEKLKDKHEIVSKILEYRNLSKINSTYIEGIKTHLYNSNKIHPIFNQTLARTGRLSCSEPNLQNIPVREELGKKIRKAFVPQNDMFLSADYSQIELRILAHISNDEKLIEVFNNNGDIHRSVAADMYNKKEEDITKMERKTAKAVIFGIVYGISGFGLGENLKITRKDADLFIKKYFELYPSVKNYMDNIVKETEELGYVKTLFNRKRVINEIKSSVFLVKQMGQRMALNTPIQGTSADIIKVAMINIAGEIDRQNLKSKMILQVHDELIFDVVQGELEILRKIVIDKMENAIKLSVPLKVETSTGTNWFEV